MTRQRASRRDDILDVFTELVAAKGYDEVSISEIAGRLDISKGTVMHHFVSKHRMLEELSLDYMARRHQELDAIEEAYGPPPARLAAVILTLMTGYRDEYLITRAFSREIMRFVDDPVMEEVRSQRRRYTARVEDIVSDGIASGDFNDRPAHLTALQIIGMCNWSWTWIKPDNEPRVEVIAQVYISNVLDGLSTASGPQTAITLPERVRELRSERARS